MKYRSFPASVTWITALLSVGTAAKPLLGSQPRTGPGNDCHSSTVVPPAATATATPAANDGVFEWAVIGDSWSSGVAYSYSTLWKLADWEFCYRTNQAYGPMMENEAGSWIDGEQKLNFVACGGTKMDDITRQLGRAGRPQLALGTFGGNDGGFGDIARACIYKPDPGPWGFDYDEDQHGTGYCKKYLAAALEFIENPAGLAKTFRSTIDNVYAISQQDGQQHPRFDLYVSSYVKFFNAETNECNDWTFSRWFSTGSPKLVKALRAEINELVGKFNEVQNRVISEYQPPGSAGVFHAHYVPISDKFEGHRFCEPNHSFEDQWYSSDVWLWNLSWKNGQLFMDPQLPIPDGNLDPATTRHRKIQARRQESDTEQDEGAGMNLTYTDGNGVMRMGKPPNALDGLFPVLSLSTENRNDLDDQYVPIGPTDGDGVDASSQCGFGWTSRPFHPKPRGANAMKDAYIGAFRANKVPGVKG
ncbi:SGNH hydrolase-type esterase domain containing protein [Naviculisporaceae sp. PSN 640]